MQSMTGFGRGAANGGGFSVTVEVNSVNRRTLEATFSLPRDWQVLERPIAEALRRSVARGRVHVTVAVDTTAGTGGLTWDDSEVEATVRRFEALAGRVGADVSRNADLLLRIVMALQKERDLPAVETAQPVVLEALRAALDQLVAMRGTEGATLAADLHERVARMKSLVDRIREDAAGRVTEYRELLINRLKQAGLDIDLDDERVLKEVAIFADRCDITEEITRLQSHLQQFDETMGSDVSEGIGRKLEFLLQEINREFNTIGSKANKLEVSKHVIEAKNEIERVREQIQNIE